MGPRPSGGGGGMEEERERERQKGGAGEGGRGGGERGLLKEFEDFLLHCKHFIFSDKICFTSC